MISQFAMAVTFAATLVTLLVAHHVADHWVQTSHQAACKDSRDWAGRVACVQHVASYTVVTAGAVMLIWAVLDLRITAVGFLTGQLVSAVTHYFADRRFTLAWLAGITKNGDFYELGAPRNGKDDNPSLGTGAYVLDQSWHWLWLFVSALLTAVLSQLTGGA